MTESPNYFQYKYCNWKMKSNATTYETTLNAILKIFIKHFTGPVSHSTRASIRRSRLPQNKRKI